MTSRVVPKNLFAALVLMVAPTLSSGCSSEVKAYEKKPGPSGKSAIEAPPTLPNKPKKADDAYTVFGLVHDLHSKVHMSEVKGKKVTVVGYIVKTNMVACKDQANAVLEDCAPECAIITKNEDQPDTCRSPVPAFFIADSPDEKAVMIPVKGWASNFPGIAKGIEAYDKELDPDKQKEIAFTDQGNRTLPNPLPAVGAKVKITGKFGPSYRGHPQPEAEPKYGIIGPPPDGPLAIEILQPALELATLPGMTRKKPKDKK